MQEYKLIVKEPEELLLMRGDYSEGALKLGAYLIANLEENKVVYKINVKEYLEKFDKKIGNYNYLYNVTKELSQKQFEMKDRFNEKFAIFNFIASANYADGTLEIEFSQRFLTYLLEIKEKYLKYDIKNIMSLSSKYSIRLYKILKDAYEKNSRYNNKAELELSIQELREILEIPGSYRFNDIKRQVLNKAKTEFAKHTDILFEYEEIKTGRKITHLNFKIKENLKKSEKTINTFVSYIKDNFLNKYFYVDIQKNIYYKINSDKLVVEMIYNILSGEWKEQILKKEESLNVFKKSFLKYSENEVYAVLIDKKIDLFEILKQRPEIKKFL